MKASSPSPRRSTRIQSRPSTAPVTRTFAPSCKTTRTSWSAPGPVRTFAAVTTSITLLKGSTV